MHAQPFNERQKKLNECILKKDKTAQAIELMCMQHQSVHASSISGIDVPSYEDDLRTKLTEDDFRRVPAKSIYSIAWHLWHSVRIEDITSTYLIAGTPQVFIQQDFINTLNVPFIDTGNGMEREETTELSENIDMDMLFRYRDAVGKNTQEIMQSLTYDMLKTKVSKEALDAIGKDGAVSPDSLWLLDFWGRKNIAGLVKMPLTRHLLTHINQAGRLLSKK